MARERPDRRTPQTVMREGPPRTRSSSAAARPLSFSRRSTEWLSGGAHELAAKCGGRRPGKRSRIPRRAGEYPARRVYRRGRPAEPRGRSSAVEAPAQRKRVSLAVHRILPGMMSDSRSEQTKRLNRHTSATCKQRPDHRIPGSYAATTPARSCRSQRWWTRRCGIRTARRSSSMAQRSLCGRWVRVRADRQRAAGSAGRHPRGPDPHARDRLGNPDSPWRRRRFRTRVSDRVSDNAVGRVALVDRLRVVDVRIRPKPDNSGPPLGWVTAGRTPPPR